MTPGPLPVDLMLTDPTAVVHAVADHLAGSWVDLAWGTGEGVWRGPAVILGCSHVAGEGIDVAVGLPTEDDQILHAYVGWDEILYIGPDADFHPPCLLGGILLDRIATASRWFGHQMALIQRDGTSVTGLVAGFDISLHDDDVLVGLVPLTSHPSQPYGDDWWALVTFDEIDSVVDLGT